MVQAAIARPKMAAGGADQAGAAGSVGLSDYTAGRTDEALRPTQPLQIAQASRLGAEPVEEFVPVARVVLTRLRAGDRAFHVVML